MKSQAAIMKEVKDLGWDYITLTKAKGFKGATKTFKNEGNEVALCFGLHEAFVVSDESGLYTAADLYEGIIKDSYFDVEESGDIDGAKTVAFEDNSTVSFTDVLADLGIDTPEIRADIEKHLLGCASLDVMEDLLL